MHKLKEAHSIVKILQEAEYQAVFAGGYVRDMIMGNTDNSHDIDIATSATPNQIQELFPNNIEVGKSFGVIVVIQDNIEFEVATFRRDSGYLDGRHPISVEYTNMEEDAKRRDLTLNGIFYDPISEKIYDFVGGQKDINNKLIKFIGDPTERILEDHLRLMRAIRFKNRLGFVYDKSTSNALISNSNLIKKVTVERIADEMTKILCQSIPRSAALKDLEKFNILSYIFPEIQAMVGCEHPVDFHPEGAKVRKILSL